MADDSTSKPTTTPAPQNTQTTVLATDSRLEVFEIDGYAITYDGIEVPSSKVADYKSAAKKQNVNLTELK